MGATLAAITFVLFISLDYLLNYRKEKARRRAPELAKSPFMTNSEAEALEPVWVGGYEFSEEPSYHPGHTWAKVTSADTVLVGMDDFARRLVGKVKKFELPKAGQWLMQGAKGVKVNTDRGVAELVSPVEGEVLRVNPMVEKDPALASSDPFRRGWLYEIRCSNLGNNMRNLLRGSVAKATLEDAKNHLEHRLMGLSRSVLADGGRPADDFADHLEPEDWTELTHSFLRN
ncbi:MAG: glycine cleavage system protein H [Planctomycetes bacterium]|nr:glycine cleavage system protein H [Planctomycetota bacterium]